MEELDSIWSYLEKVDELKQKLLDTTMELESVEMEAREQIKKSHESIKNLHNLVKIAYKERDEAREQLQKILLNKKKLMVSNKNQPKIPTILPQIRPEIPTSLPQNQPESPLFLPTKENSSTESNSLSDSLLDAGSSPEFSNINMADSNNLEFLNQQFVQDYNVLPSNLNKIDHGFVLIDNLLKGKPLPQKGKLLQYVMDAGPLLQTLLVAGPLPRWQNPPPLQTFKIPPVSIKGCEASSVHKRKPLESSLDSSQTCSDASILNFGAAPSTSCCNNNLSFFDTSLSFDQTPAAKRRRLH
ncbi:hypothetical protein UlMin_013519 [Ulmus minor]